MAIADAVLVPAQTVTTKGDGPTVDVSDATSRVFLVTRILGITVGGTLSVGSKV